MLCGGVGVSFFVCLVHLGKVTRREERGDLAGERFWFGGKERKRSFDGKRLTGHEELRVGMVVDEEL